MGVLGLCYQHGERGLRVDAVDGHQRAFGLVDFGAGFERVLQLVDEFAGAGVRW